MRLVFFLSVFLYLVKEVFEMKRTTQVNTYKMNQNVVYCNIKGLLMLQNFILELLELHFQ